MESLKAMSRKSNYLDNGRIKGFFGVLKRKMVYGFEIQFKNLNELKKAINKHISNYNKLRSSAKLKGLIPIEYRKISSQ